MHFYPICLAKTPEMADALLAAGAKITGKPYNDGGHIIDHPAMYGPPSMIQWFIDHGVDVSKVNDGPMAPTILFWARSPEVAELLIDHGIDINVKDAGGQTAMFRIEQRQDNAAEIIPVLLKHGADPNMRTEYGYTPLMAARDGATVDVLIAAGADPNAKDANGVSVIDIYGPLAEPSRIAALRKHGVIPTATENAGLLRNATLRGNVGEVKSLLAAGANPNLAQEFRAHRPAGHRRGSRAMGHCRSAPPGRRQ
jgi:hypothetical protein